MFLNRDSCVSSTPNDNKDYSNFNTSVRENIIIAYGIENKYGKRIFYNVLSFK